MVSGNAACWGENDLDQLGDGVNGAGGSATDSDVPVSVVGPSGSGYLNGIKSINGGGQADQLGNGYCAVISTGGLDCWGEADDWGELGDGTMANSPIPVPVVAVGG